VTFRERPGTSSKRRILQHFFSENRQLESGFIRPKSSQYHQL